MKTKRFILAVITILILCLTASAMLAGCGDKKDDAKSSSGSSGSKALLTVDGADIKSVELRLVGETPNLSVVFANSTDKDITVEAGKFSVKTSDGKSYPFFESKTVLEANQSYIQHAYTAFKDDPSFKEGDTVEIYYGDTLLDTVEVTTFG